MSSKTAEAAARMRGSLLLMEPEYLQLHVGAWGSPKQRVKTSFLYNETHYSLAVTDPLVERIFLRKTDGAYALEKSLLCVSLTEENEDGWCYKVVASVIGRRYDD